MTEQPLLRRKATPTQPTPPIWTTRLLLAACLFFASEVILWTDVARPVWTWPFVVLGYVGVAALLLDLMTRYRVHELFGGLVLAGVYGLLASALLNPAVAFVGLPLSLVTRVMGAQTAAGVLGLALYLGLVGGVRRNRLWIGAVGIGLVWGVWVRGTPLVVGVPETATTLPLMLTWGLLAGGWVLALAQAAARLPLTNGGVVGLTRLLWGGVGAALVVVLAVRGFQGYITRDVLSYVLVLLFFCIVILWFQHSDENTTLLALRTPPSSPPLLNLVMALGLLLGAGALAYQLPTSEDSTVGALQLISVAFGGFGLAWLPAVCVVLGVRAYRHTTRTGKSL